MPCGHDFNSGLSRVEFMNKSGVSIHRAQTNETVNFNPFTPTFFQNPYGPYEKLRTLDPISKSGNNGWLVSRYQDVTYAMLNSDLSVNPRNWAGFSAHCGSGDSVIAAEEAIKDWIVMLDFPDHTHIRSLLTPELRRIDYSKIGSQVELALDDLVHPLLDVKRFDLMNKIAKKIPAITTCKLLGVPLEYDRQVVKWCRDLLPALDPLLRQEDAVRVNKAITEFTVLLKELSKSKLDGTESDLLSNLLTATKSNKNVSFEKLIANCIFLFLASYETTTNLIGNGMLAFMRFPDEYKKLQENPLLIQSAVEEALRFDSPVQLTYRNAHENFKLGEKHIEKGDQLMLLIGSANRDPSVFEDPEKFNISKQRVQHLAFGRGMHTCLGVNLAKLQGKIVFTAIAEKFPNIRMADDTLKWKPSLMVRGLLKLPVTTS